MIPRRHPLTRTWLRPNRVRESKHSHPGGEYIFTHRGKQYSLPGKMIQDRTSPSADGLRWVAHPKSKPTITSIVYELAGGHCQMHKSPSCWGWMPRGVGHPHHVRHKKMGNAFGDDRIWIEIDGEQVQIRILGCPSCHRNHHNKLQWTGKSA
jgi:hypothetical protein